MTVAACQKFVQANLVWDNHTYDMPFSACPRPCCWLLVPGLAMARRPMAMWLFLQLLAQQLAQWYVVASINLPENNCGAMAKGMQWLSLIMGAGPDSTAGRSTLGKHIADNKSASILGLTRSKKREAMNALACTANLPSCQVIWPWCPLMPCRGRKSAEGH